MQKMPEIQISDFYMELLGFAISILVIMWLKDAMASLLESLKFRNSKHFKEGDKVILDGQDAMIISIGWWKTVFGIYGEKGYTWRFISNKKIENIKLEKIVDPDLHPDTAEEKAEKVQKVLNKKS